MSGQVHWWLVALSFVLGMVLTLTLTVRPARVEMPAWVFADPMAGTRTEPEAPAPDAAEPPPAPAEPPVVAAAPAAPRTPGAPVEEPSGGKTPEGQPRHAKKEAVKASPPKRGPVPRDLAGKRAPTARKRPVRRVPANRRKEPKRAPVVEPGRHDISARKPRAPRKPLMPYAPYGPGSMRAEPDGSGPEGWPVKGRTDSRLYYAPGDTDYDATEAQVWFENEELAIKAFFSPGRDGRSD
ncbi:hypothetical protein [Mycobacterium sp.]|uniref:channel accessory protein ArfC, sunset domain variant n=1 Tax=Mycobacterium sp. TaxID=1785 RepID=UPI003A8C6C32